MDQPLSDFEKVAKGVIERHFGETYWAEYLVARQRVFNDVVSHIYGKEPHLSDHSERHILDVMNRAFLLLGKDNCDGRKGLPALRPVEIYFLVYAILFHDVGNVFSRRGHPSKLGEAYEYCRGSGQKFMAERRLLFKIVEAHGGKTASGSPDTIGPLETSAVFNSQDLDCRRVAALLRFADELAEGPHRTSLFMQEFLSYPADSEIYHDYANVTDIRIDRGGRRIVVGYNIEIAPSKWKQPFDAKRLKKLLEFCHHRLEKLDLERRYNRFYCELLEPFEKTEATFHFSCRNKHLETDLPKIVLDDLVLPNAFSTDRISKASPTHKIGDLMPKLKAAASRPTKT